ncbi:putative transposase [Variovorax boronicumulans]|nr:putative transposase [Variovorax boronicumulans]
MGISRQAYYQGQHRATRRHERAEAVVQLVKEQRMRQPRLGTRKLHYLLREPLQRQDIELGRDAMFDVLRNARLLVANRRAYHKTTDSHHRFRRHPNLVKAGPTQIRVTRSEQLWVADITYLATVDKVVYLSLVTDAHSRKIVGWHVHASLQTEEVARALKMALRERKTREQPVHHSDRGIQYCSNYYQALHRRHGLKCSMTDGYDCYQNALAERINGILKTEFLLSQPTDLAQARRLVPSPCRSTTTSGPICRSKCKRPMLCIGRPWSAEAGYLGVNAIQDGSCSVRQPLRPQLLQDRRRDFLDRLGGGREPTDAGAPHHRFGFAHLVAAVLQARVARVGPSLVADLAQALGLDRQAKDLLAVRHQRRR